MRENLPIRYSASSYDRYTDGFVAIYDDAMLSRLAEEYAARGGERLLVDVGTGTARLLVKLAQRSGLEKIRMIGLDYFEDMLAQARATVSESGMTGRIDIVQGDAHQLPFPSESVDFVISRSTIHHWAQPIRALAEIHRILNPGGVALIHDIRRDPNPDVFKEFSRKREQAGITVPCRLDEKYTPQEVSEMLREAGLLEHASIAAPTQGPGALGFEVRIKKPRLQGIPS